MKKLLVVLLLSIISISCENAQDVENDLEKLRVERKDLRYSNRAIKTTISEQLDILNGLKEESKILGLKVDGKKPVFVLKLRLKQSRMSLSISDHMKDSANAINFEIPVDEEFYNSISVGDELVDNVRMGSLVLKGSFSSWNITVRGKRIHT